MNVENTAIITLDTDWVPVPIMDYVLDRIIPPDLPATFFVTNSYPELLNSRRHEYELAPHTNPVELNEDEITRELERKIALCVKKPSGHRGHSLYWTERLRPLFRDYGIRYDSSTMMYLESDIRPFRVGYDLLQIPLFFMDFFHFEYCGFNGTDPFSLNNLQLEKKGLKVFDFHPIHLYLNTPNLDFYASVKAHYQQPEKLAALRYEGYGIQNFFLDIIDKLQQLGYQFSTLNQVLNSYTQ